MPPTTIQQVTSSKAREREIAHCAALVPAAGLGTRLGLGPKALLKLGSRTLLEILLDTLRQVTDTIVVAAPPSHLDQFRDLAGDNAEVIAGGRERRESLERLINATDKELLLMQDAARPFVSARLCRNVVNQAAIHGAAGAFLDPLVPVAHLEPDYMVRKSWPRERAGIFQAPRAYQKQLLTEAARKTRGRDFDFLEHMVFAAGFGMRSVEGEVTNIKITTSWDWAIARKVVAPLMNLE